MVFRLDIRVVGPVYRHHQRWETNYAGQRDEESKGQFHQASLDE